jgi:hypothetical protein
MLTRAAHVCEGLSSPTLQLLACRPTDVLTLCCDMQVGNPLVESFGSCTLTGMEPGYAKTNQDMTMILPRLDDESHALFGVLDGHGTNGALLPPSSLNQAHCALR